MKIHWISWYQPTEDHRPLTYPPNAAVLGWWCTGESSDGSATLCAYILADDEAAAKAAVSNDWPEAQEWRFCEERQHIDPSSRFPFSDWMEDRVKPYLTAPQPEQLQSALEVGREGSK